ncbi:MAG: hypothetical protein IKE28_09505 [Solobacterium sp.]|nr:hypothetical protein [Solobacterium sp.]
MLDINNNGKLDPEEEALEDVITEGLAGESRKTRSLSFIMILVALIIILLISAIIFLSK